MKETAYEQKIRLGKEDRLGRQGKKEDVACMSGVKGMKWGEKGTSKKS